MTTLPFTIEYMKERMQAAYKAGTLLAQADFNTRCYYYRKLNSNTACAVGACFDRYDDIPEYNSDGEPVFDSEISDTEMEFFVDGYDFNFACKAQFLHDKWGVDLRSGEAEAATAYETLFRQHIGL
jgi:hypothetical protein